MAFSEIDPARLEGDALTRWYLRSPADIEQERQQAAAQKYQDFFGGNAPDTPPVATPQRGSTGVGRPPFGLIPDDAASPMTGDANGNYQLAAASWTPSGDWLCQACHGRGVLPPPPPTLYTPPRDPGGATPYPGGGGSSGKNPKAVRRSVRKRLKYLQVGSWRGCAPALLGECGEAGSALQPDERRGGISRPDHSIGK